MPAKPATSKTTAQPKTEGQRLLVAVPASATEVGRAVGSSKQIVAYWRAGKKLPSDGARAKLEKAYAIPVASWDGVPTASPTDAQPTPALAPLAPPALGRLDREILYVEGLAHDSALSPTVRVRYQVELNKLIVEAEKRDQRERERNESLVADPRVARIIATVLEAVGPWVPALNAVEAALEKLRAEEAR